MLFELAWEILHRHFRWFEWSLLSKNILDQEIIPTSRQPTPSINNAWEFNIGSKKQWGDGFLEKENPSNKNNFYSTLKLNQFYS